jgi:hypothetical protein
MILELAIYEVHHVSHNIHNEVYFRQRGIYVRSTRLDHNAQNIPNTEQCRHCAHLPPGVSSCMKIMELLSLRMSPTESLWKHEIPVGVLASLHNEQDPPRSITGYTALQTQEGGHMRAYRKLFGCSGGSSTRCSRSAHAQYDPQANNVYLLQPVFNMKVTNCSTANVKRARLLYAAVS